MQVHFLEYLDQHRVLRSWVKVKQKTFTGGWCDSKSSCLVVVIIMCCVVVKVSLLGGRPTYIEGFRVHYRPMRDVITQRRDVITETISVSGDVTNASCTLTRLLKYTW